MSKRKKKCITAPAPENAINPAASEAATTRPAWITDELIALTLKIWQPFYSVRLSVQDAADIILNAGWLMATLARSACDRRVNGLSVGGGG